MALEYGVEELEALRLGHNLLSIEQYAALLMSGDLEILMIPYGAILVDWGECADGKVMNILTVTGNITDNVSLSVQAFEGAARERGAKVILSLGRTAYAKILEPYGYQITYKVLMRKDL